MKIIKKMLKIILIIFGIIVVSLLIMLPIDLKNQNKIKKMVIEEIDLSKLENGQYTGEFKKDRWLYNVTITINDHKITDIKFSSNSSQLGSYSDELVDKIIEEQKIDVDTVSGATVSSKAILKAVEDALK